MDGKNVQLDATSLGRLIDWPMIYSRFSSNGIWVALVCFDLLRVQLIVACFTYVGDEGLRLSVNFVRIRCNSSRVYLCCKRDLLIAREGRQ